MIRFVASYSLDFFGPVYFEHIYPENATEFGAVLALCACFLGFIGSLVGGVLSDKYADNYMSNAYILMISCLSATPIFALCFLKQDNFWISVAMFGSSFLVAELWLPPYIAMLQNSSSKKTQSFALTIYLFFATAAGTLTT